MVKYDYAHTMATLLCLDRPMIDDLMQLDITTLAKMYVNYVQNAKDSNHAIERAADARKQKLTSGRD